MAVSCKGTHCPPAIMRSDVRWSVADPLRTRHGDERRRERGVHGDHTTLHRGVITYSPPLEAAFHRRTRPVWGSWRLDATSIRVKGEWR